jgi:SAM-dependent methyltransferase
VSGEVPDEEINVSHPEQLGFFAEVVRANDSIVANGKVIEIGSYDVNGSVRKIFQGAEEYVGVDLRTGPGVDLVAYGHEVDRPDDYFDFALSGECFEHDPHWSQTFQNMCRMTRAGGLVAFTCASRGRPEHGTRRTDLEESPGTQSRGLDYYRNLQADDFKRELPLASLFSSYRFWYLPTSFDLYFAGIRSAGPAQKSADPSRKQARLPDETAVANLRQLMSVPHRLARLPLRLLMRTLNEQRYQNWALPYWRGLLRAQDRVSGGAFRRAGRS